MSTKVAVILEQDENGWYVWCPELKGCHSQGESVDQALANIREAIDLYLETMDEDERSAAMSHEILTTAIEVHV